MVRTRSSSGFVEDQSLNDFHAELARYFFFNTFTVLHFDLNLNCYFVRDREYRRVSWNRSQRLVNETSRSPRKVSKLKHKLKAKRQTGRMIEELAAAKQSLSKVPHFFKKELLQNSVLKFFNKLISYFEISSKGHR